ncbi:MAG: hypothetical protein LBC45_03645 [Chlamydiales bacterium]|jgi:hypothetical protein|nr:hypothetical protein [Chlamydiales bacterium]
MTLINAVSNFLRFTPLLDHPKINDYPFVNHLIKRLYKNIEWPSHMQRICILTKVEKDQDLISAAKVIFLMQRICPISTFDWVLQGCIDKEKCLSLLQDRSKVHIRCNDLEKSRSADFICIDLEKTKNTFLYQTIKTPFFIYKKLIESHSDLIEELSSFAHPRVSNLFVLPKSLGYGKRSFLHRIKEHSLLVNLELKNLTKMHSLNFGYIDHPSDLRNFIDYITIHETHKHVIIIANQTGDIEQGQLTPAFFHSEQLMLFKERGYGKIVFKEQDREPILLQQAKDPLTERDLTIIIHHLLTPNDIKWLQFASEILFTNDPTFINDLKWLQKASVELLSEDCHIHEEMVVGAIKQAAWHYLISELEHIENKNFDSTKENPLQNIYKKIEKKIVEYKMSKMSLHQKKILLLKDLDLQLSHYCFP